MDRQSACGDTLALAHATTIGRADQTNLHAVALQQQAYASPDFIAYIGLSNGERQQPAKI
jgi:hypothetical protein